METFGVRACEGVVDGKLECGRSGTSVIKGQCDFVPKLVFLYFGFRGFLP